LIVFELFSMAQPFYSYESEFDTISKCTRILVEKNPRSKLISAKVIF
jgi:hypothetical protein